MSHPTDCHCPDCDPDTHNDDAAIAADEDTDPALHFWASQADSIDWEAIANTPPPDEDTPF